jgi:hypothetical protein
MNMTDVVRKDHELERANEMTSEELAHHRWHWTLDESNPDRVSLHAYAKATGRGYATIRRYANGYNDWVVHNMNQSLADCLMTANMAVEKVEVAEAIAEVEGVAVSTVVNRRGTADSIANLTDQAKEAAERKNITLTEAAREIGERRKQTRELEARQTRDRKANQSRVYNSIEGHLANAKRRLSRALDEAHDVGFSEEELELIRTSIDQIRSVLNLLDLRLAGTPDIDWDAELASLGGDR